jgi:replicative DNA helicase Mcm
MNFNDIVHKLNAFFTKGNIQNRGKNRNDLNLFSYWDELLNLCYEYPYNKSLDVEYRHIESFDSELAEELLNCPEEWLKAASTCIASIDFPLNELPDITVRVTGLPFTHEIAISRLRNIHLEKFVSIRCVISKATEVRPAYEKCAFQCMRCGHVTIVPQSKDTDLLQEPFAGCENESCGKKGPFKKLESESVTFNHQYLKVQEPLENLRGRQPEFLYISCADELTGTVKPGDKVIITGILKGRQKVSKEGKTKFLDFLFIANSIQKSDKDFENITITQQEEAKFIELAESGNAKSMICASIAPSVYGYENIKEGVGLQMFSGNRREMKDGTTKRGDIHILLVGDPGVAKSQILKFVHSFAPRAVMVSGRSTSAAGLTGAAVHDDFDGKWAIEAGAMTMAGEGGICCVDEMDKMRETDRAAMHVALEQQAVDIAKAGVFAHLPTVCSLLGAANPKYGRYDKYESIATQFNLGDALISRMDLLYVIQDVVNPEFDEKLAWHVLDDDEETKPIMDLEFLRKYIAYSKTKCCPKMSNEAKEYIKNFYVKTRVSGGKTKDTIPVTVRTLESAKRLATANAKMRLSDTVTEQDAEDAVKLLLDNLHSVGIDPETGELDASVLISGTSMSQRDSIIKLRKIILSISSNNLKSGNAHIDDIKKACEVEGIKNVDSLLKKMRVRGDVFTENNTTYKLITR